MARFLFTVWPYHGHYNPCIAIGRELRVRGHEVAFLMGPGTAVDEEGFVRFPAVHLAAYVRNLVGDDGAADGSQLYGRLTERYTSVAESSPWARARVIRAMFREMVVGSVRAQAADVEAVLDRWPPDAIVTDVMMWGPILVTHETRAVPVAPLCFFAGCLIPGPECPAPGSGLPPPRSWATRLLNAGAGLAGRLLTRDVRAAANDVRRDFGLPPLRATVAEHAGTMPLYLVTSTPNFDFDRGDLPPSVRYVGPCLWDRSDGESAPAWIEECGGDGPVVYVSEGTAQVREPALLRAAIQGLGGLPMRVVATTGRRRDPAKLQLGSLPENVRLEAWAPHSALFPKVDVVVTNGGSGTVRGALQAGIPLVVVPMEWDQLDNAQRIVESGAGVRLPLRKCSPERLRAAVENVLADPRYRRNAERMAEDFARHPQAAGAAQLLEDLVAAPKLGVLRRAEDENSPNAPFVGQA